MADVTRYHEQIRAAREAGLALVPERERDLLDLLERYAEEIAERLRAGGTEEAEQLYATVRELAGALARDAAERVGRGVLLTAERVAQIHTAAVTGLLTGTGVGVPTAFRTLGVQAAQAVLARPELAEAFVSLRRDAAGAVNDILRRGILRGAPTTSIAREIRLCIGAPGSLVEGDAALLSDLRRIGYDTLRELGYSDPTPEDLAQVRREAGKIRDQAQLIARQETITAEHEVNARAAAVSPVVAAVRLRLSGRHPVPDQCDTAAAADLFGLGAGHYPPDKVPARFHPRCICFFTHVLRPEAEWASPRPASPDLRADLNWESLREEYGLAPSQLAALQRSVSIGEARFDARRAA